MEGGPEILVPDGTVDRQLPENCVEYLLFILDGHQPDVRKIRLQLETVRRAALQLSHTLTKDYIWQRGDFNLELKTENGLLYLHGATDYGDAMEDEWLIVFMLRELTKSHPNLWVRVADSDGEFLLVEAANVLPGWLNPEIDHCRVWIHQGKLLIIPLDDEKMAPARSKSRLLSLPQAVDFVKSKPAALIHSTSIEAEAFYRLDKYPKQVGDSIHHSLVIIPRKLAHVLHSLPKSVSPAVECFYLRDPIALKPVLSTSGPLVFPPQDLVTISVRFSKVLFAQLKSQRFDAPPRWEVLLRNAPSGKSSSDEASKKRERLETGMKLTCGFEMLALHAEKSNSRVVREVAIVLEDLEEDGEAALPADKEIESWHEALRDDDESWLDINYEDFERELQGKQVRDPAKAASGFGDAQTQENLRKIVSRFESFLSDEKAGFEGAELDSMDFDDDDDEEEEEESEGDDKDVGFDEEAFSMMMREMMGLSATDPCERQTDVKGKSRENQCNDDNSSRGGDDDNDDDDDKAIQQLSSWMEAELKEHGALKLDVPGADGHPKLKGAGETEPQGQRPEAAEEDSDEDVDIDYNLAKNLLESFKSQGGMAGPAGNLLGLMGFQLPRDEDDGSDDQDAHDASRPHLTSGGRTREARSLRQQRSN